MRVEAGVTELSDLLGQKLDTVGRVTEDDGLVDLKLNHDVSMKHANSCDASNRNTLEKRVLRQWTFCLSSTYA